MATKLVMPKLGLSLTEAKIIEWLKNEGDAVEKGFRFVASLQVPL
jgi:pyruvate/2-oxoglutarate dehydrogenase complex dihydrolipoamide acyltransferase (E2) component